MGERGEVGGSQMHCSDWKALQMQRDAVLSITDNNIHFANEHDGLCVEGVIFFVCLAFGRYESIGFLYLFLFFLIFFFLLLFFSLSLSLFQRTAFNGDALCSRIDCDSCVVCGAARRRGSTCKHSPL